MRIEVECHAGYRGEREPRRLHFGPRAVAVTEILDRWLGPDQRYFKLLGSDGDIYILRHEVATHDWSVAYFRHTSAGDRTTSELPGLHAMKTVAQA